MPQTAEDTELLNTFKQFSPERQKALLAKMSPEQKARLKSAFVAQAAPPTPTPASATVPESTFGTRAREAAIGVLEPFTLGSLRDMAKQVWGAGKQILTGGGTAEAQQLIKGMIMGPLGKIPDYVNAIKEGDYDRAAYDAGGILSQTVPLVSGAADLAGTPEGALGVTPGALKEGVRRAAQSATGSSAFRTTEPMVEKFTETSEKVAKQQSESDANVAEKNRQNEAAAAKKTEEQAASFEKKSQEQRAGHQQDVKDTLAANREAEHTNARSEAVERSLKEGSQKLGERVKELDAKLRAEANGKYSTVREAVKDDPGVPLGDLAQAANHAETNILKGSPETIKQFRDLARKAPEESGVHTSVGDIRPGDPLYEMLKSQGAIDTGGTIPFDQLQGYSSEIGAKLAKGGLPGDVYQALKYLKDKIDVAKTTIADRNGVGAALRNADSFWRNYMDAFYDSDSAVAKVRESVGTLDPEFYADAFTKGKAGDVAISRLKQLKTQHAADANAVADLARDLRKAKTELDATSTAKAKPIPDAPKPGQAPNPVTAKVIPNREITKPEPPTAEDIVEAKAKKVKQTGASIGTLSKFDLAYPAEFIGGIVSGHPVVGALLHPLVKFGTSYLLQHPAVVEWIAQPTASDLAAIEKLPEPARAQLRTNLQEIIDKEKKAGRSPRISPEVKRLLQAGPVSGGVKNRREALEGLGRGPQ